MRKVRKLRLAHQPGEVRSQVIESLFWISIAAIIYTYAGYPTFVSLLSRLRKREVRKAYVQPRVSIVIACHNEQDNIDRRIRNLLDSDYPADLMEIIIVSDGSTDLTAEAGRRYAAKNVHLLAYENQKGKATALNVGVEIASGEVIVFGDARQSFEPAVIKELVSNFADSTVGAVSGELLLDGGGSASVGEGVGLYWKYEKWIRKSESRAGSTIGATGAIYAIRRALWRPLPPNTILDDVYTPMSIALTGHRVVFEEKARAHDISTDSARREFARKVRTLTGNYQLCQLMPRLLLPNSLLIFQFYSHKLMRLVSPIFFLILFATNLILAASSAGSIQLLYQAVFAGQVLFYAGVLAGGYLLKRNRKVRLLNFAYVFSLMNAAALVGLVYFLLGKRNVWARSE
jgi:cellulose synthase/poly-beta-1,6-N-acetylglucosamine synthase-like glycosyltransferase